MLGLPLIWVASGRKVWLCVAVVTTRYSHQEATKTLRGHICIKFDVLRCCDFEADSDTSVTEQVVIGEDCSGYKLESSRHGKNATNSACHCFPPI